MVENEEYVCRRKKVGEVFEIVCGIEKEGNEETEILQCIMGSEGKSGGVSIFGMGGQYGEQKPTITCFTDGEVREEVAKKLKVKKENIKLIESEGN